jgi:hypothetical protein
MRLRNKLAAIAVGIMGLAGVFVASPAQAAGAPNYSCAADAVCLYQWEGFSGPSGEAGRWQSSFYNISIHGGQCLNIPNATWPNGDPVADNSGSLVVNGTGSYSDQVGIFVYNFANCAGNGASGGDAGFNAHVRTTVSDLHTLHMTTSINAYHTITSILIYTP